MKPKKRRNRKNTAYVSPGKKICTQCKRLKPLSAYRWKVRAKRQVVSRCRACDKAYRANLRAANRIEVCDKMEAYMLRREAEVVAGRRTEPSTKHCGKCKQIKPSRAFRWSNKSRLIRFAWCKPCDAKYRKGLHKRSPWLDSANKARRMSKLKQLVETLKNNPCLDCGGRFTPCVMDFDHRDPSQKIDKISRLSAGKLSSKKKLLDEIAKCDLVCANCHRLRTCKQGQHKHFGIGE